MKDPFRKILTKTVFARENGLRFPPSEGILYIAYFSLGMVACLTVLGASHLVVLGKWNSEVFMIISGLIGNITGTFLSHR